MALAVPNGPDFLQVLLAVLELGAVAAPLNPSYTEDEYAFYLEDLAPRLLLLPGAELPAARAAAAKVNVAVVDVSARKSGTPGFARNGVQLRSETNYEGATPDDAALLLHTSGTTSRPKQVPLAHRNLTASALNIATFYDSVRPMSRTAPCPSSTFTGWSRRRSAPSRGVARSWSRSGSRLDGCGLNGATTGSRGSRPDRRSIR